MSESSIDSWLCSQAQSALDDAALSVTSEQSSDRGVWEAIERQKKNDIQGLAREQKLQHFEVDCPTTFIFRARCNERGGAAA